MDQRAQYKKIVNECVARQKSYFQTGATRSLEFRLHQLRALRRGLQDCEEPILDALKSDLNKHPFESYTGEVAVVYNEIDHIIRHLKRWMKPRRVRTPLAHLPGKSFIVPRPKGVCAIISPWNYPVNLSMAPLAAAIAAGNTAILHNSDGSPAAGRVLRNIIENTFNPEYICCVEGDYRIGAELTAAPVDHVFFTGSTAVGKKVLRAAAEHLTPVTLELGGKSPAVVTPGARLDIAARRVAWGRLLNAGQICVAVDYACVHRSVFPEFLDCLKEEIQRFYGEDAAGSPFFGRIVNERQFERIALLMERQNSIAAPVYGGRSSKAELYVEPTVYAPAGWNDPVMEEEIFAPLLPVIVYDSLDELMGIIAARPAPLAAYLFSNSKRDVQLFENRLSFGGAVINDTVVHLANPRLPFGGCGPSGQGSYHGETGFRTFSHVAGIMKRSSKIDIALKYPPYGRLTPLIRKMLRL